ncbi:ATP-binding protein [Selenomonas sp. AB3002]|uniref:ATP-binding protein n=1 Tax=Selenomonas sp. AB3002 TaxID=1392502 RepID=UPI000AA52C15
MEDWEKVVNDLRAKHQATGQMSNINLVGNKSGEDISRQMQEDAMREAREKRKTAAIQKLPKRFQATTLDSIRAQGIPKNKSVAQNWQYICQYTDHLAEHLKAGRGIILAGGFGTMKTTLAVAVLRKYIDGGGWGVMVTMASLIDKIYSMRNTDASEAAAYETEIREAKLLVIDDLGAEDNHFAWVLAKVDSIISSRYDNRLATIITTNYSPDDLSQTYGGRLIDRIKSNCFYLPFVGVSERKPLDLSMI